MLCFTLLVYCDHLLFYFHLIQKFFTPLENPINYMSLFNIFLSDVRNLFFLNCSVLFDSVPNLSSWYNNGLLEYQQQLCFVTLVSRQTSSSRYLCPLTSSFSGGGEAKILTYPEKFLKWPMRVLMSSILSQFF